MQLTRRFLQWNLESRDPELNWKPPVYKTGALPIELQRPYGGIIAFIGRLGKGFGVQGFKFQVSGNAGTWEPVAAWICAPSNVKPETLPHCG